MHTNVRRFIKTSIVFLFAGLLIGAWMMVQRDVYGTWPSPFLISAHAHAVQLGFVMFLILGVALWLFPKPPADDTRYRHHRVLAAYVILTVATTIRLVAEVGRAIGDSEWLAPLVVATGLAQIGGFGLYFWTMWPRIRPVGSQLREAKGERF